MKIVIQRCRAAQVEVDGAIVGRIEKGLAIFVGIESDDDEKCAARLAQKIVTLRIFDNSEGKFDLSLRDIGGGALVISNFTLLGDTRKGARPNFSASAPPETARLLFNRFVTLLRETGVDVESGIFGAQMNVSVENDGPVTMILN